MTESPAATAAYPTTCPHCGADLTNPDGHGGDSPIRTDETTPGTCYAYVDEGGRLEFDGETRMAWDCQTTDAVYCNACDGSLDGPASVKRDPASTLLAGMKTVAELLHVGEVDDAESALADYIGGAEQMDGVVAETTYDLAMQAIALLRRIAEIEGAGSSLHDAACDARDVLADEVPGQIVYPHDLVGVARRAFDAATDGRSGAVGSLIVQVAVADRLVALDPPTLRVALAMFEADARRVR
jgi:hypothetical protein